MVDDHRLDGGIPAPPGERVDHRLAHRQVERVNRLGAIERQATDAAVGADQNIFGHWRSRSLPTIIRITWFVRSGEHTSELQSLMRISYAVFCLEKKTNEQHRTSNNLHHT